MLRDQPPVDVGVRANRRRLALRLGARRLALPRVERRAAGGPPEEVRRLPRPLAQRHEPGDVRGPRREHAPRDDAAVKQTRGVLEIRSLRRRRRRRRSAERGLLRRRERGVRASRAGPRAGIRAGLERVLLRCRARGARLVAQDARALREAARLDERTARRGAARLRRRRPSGGGDSLRLLEGLGGACRRARMRGGVQDARARARGSHLGPPREGASRRTSRRLLTQLGADFSLARASFGDDAPRRERRRLVALDPRGVREPLDVFVKPFRVVRSVSPRLKRIRASRPNAFFVTHRGDHRVATLATRVFAPTLEPNLFGTVAEVGEPGEQAFSADARQFPATRAPEPSLDSDASETHSFAVPPARRVHDVVQTLRNRERRRGVEDVQIRRVPGVRETSRRRLVYARHARRRVERPLRILRCSPTLLNRSGQVSDAQRVHQAVHLRRHRGARVGEVVRLAPPPGGLPALGVGERRRVHAHAQGLEGAPQYLSRRGGGRLQFFEVVFRVQRAFLHGEVQGQRLERWQIVGTSVPKRLRLAVRASVFSFVVFSFRAGSARLVSCSRSIVGRTFAVVTRWHLVRRNVPHGRTDAVPVRARKTRRVFFRGVGVGVGVGVARRPKRRAAGVFAAGVF